MSVFEHKDFDHHEGVHFLEDPVTGLKAVIAVHSTVRGPSAGGTRFWFYPSSADALTDALRLSRAMSFKNAMADLPLGGGKGVVMKPDRDYDRTALFSSYGRAINRLNGTYITAEDVGMTPKDMGTIRTETEYVGGMDSGPAASGDPSPVTAEGVFRGLCVAAKHRLGATDLSSIRVAVQGLGHVGYHLCQFLHKAGAKLLVADINTVQVERAVTELGATAVPVESVHAQDVDIFAPCALGGAINSKTLPGIKASIVGGAANNQLATPDMGDAMMTRDILFCPDYVINAGGIINIAAELRGRAEDGRYEIYWVKDKLNSLEQTLADIFTRAQQTGQSTSAVADMMAQERITPPTT